MSEYNQNARIICLKMPSISIYYNQYTVGYKCQITIKGQYIDLSVQYKIMSHYYSKVTLLKWQNKNLNGSFCAIIIFFCQAYTLSKTAINILACVSQLRPKLVTSKPGVHLDYNLANLVFSIKKCFISFGKFACLLS